MRNKATHKGTCQVCGREQKLPNGRLSVHGYTTRCGFFEGVCAGAEHLPFEQDESLIEGSIGAALIRAESIRKIQDGLRAEVPADETKAWVSVYFPYRSRFQPSGYEWHQVVITSEFVPYSDEIIDHTKTEERGYIRFKREKVDGEMDTGAHNRQWSNCGKKNTLAQEIQALNSKKADSYNRTLEEIKSYVSWQRARIKDWAPHPEKLKPIK